MINMFRRPGLIASLLRGAKKGKGKGEEVKIEATTDVINIFKDRTDPELKPREEYPAWLFPMVYEFQSHPTESVMRMYKGEKLEFSVREQRRLVKWSRRTKIIVNNHSKHNKVKTDPRRSDLLELGLPGGDDSDMDPEDVLGPLLRLAIGVPPKILIQESLEKVQMETGFLKIPGT
jgi:large subunit ribosomal protein L54